MLPPYIIEEAVLRLSTDPMKATHKALWVIALGALFWPGLSGQKAGAHAGGAESLYQQSLALLLERRFNSPELSYLLVDAGSGAVLAARWDRPDEPVPPGSLLKPFTALAYAEGHGFSYPSYVCRGAVDGCWLPRGHGHIGIQRAVAGSCNVYFRKLASEAAPADVSAVAWRLGLGTVPPHLAGRSLIGLGGGWQVSPLDILRAYSQLASRRGDPGVRELIEGMELSAEGGTAGAIGGALRSRAGVPRVLAKTGTARCVHQHKAPGDGYVVALWPAESPRFALLVGVHGVPGARAAAVCGEMIRVLAATNRQF